MTKKKVFQQPLKQEWADALLDYAVLPVALQEMQALSFASIRERRLILRQMWEDTLKETREVVRNHPLAPLVAQHAAREAGKRGSARLVVNDAGDVLLEVSYKGVMETAEATPIQNKLPSLGTLRAAAVQYGVDVSDLGRKKLLIIARLVPHGYKLNGSAKKEVPKTKRMKRAPALTEVKMGPGPFGTKPLLDLEALVTRGSSLDVSKLLQSESPEDY